MGFATLIGYQLYVLTKDPLSLGWLGLIQAIPALSFSLLGGHIADRGNRKLIVLAMATWEVIAMLLLMVIAWNVASFGLISIYAVVFLIGIASGFYRPASSAFEQQVIPLRHAAKGSSWMSSVWQAGAITGGPLTGLAIDRLGIPITYLIIAILFAFSVLFLSLIPAQPAPPAHKGEGLRE